MDIKVKRFSIRHENKTYKPGDVIRGLSSEEAERIAGLPHFCVEILGDEGADTEGSIKIEPEATAVADPEEI